MFTISLCLPVSLSAAGLISIASAIKGSPIIKEGRLPAVSMSHAASSNNIHFADDSKDFINLSCVGIECRCCLYGYKPASIPDRYYAFHVEKFVR